MMKTLRSFLLRFVGVLITTGLPGLTFYRQTQRHGLMVLSWLALAALVAAAATAYHHRKEYTA